MELCDVQADSFVRGKRHRDSEEFRRLVSEEKYPKLNYFALRFSLLVGRTYVRESAFSTMKLIKSKTRTCRLDSQMLSACLRLALTEIPVSDGWGRSPPRKTALKYFFTIRHTILTCARKLTEPA